MDNLSGICKLRNHLQAGWPKPRHIKPQTELHMNNPSLQQPGQNPSLVQRKRQPRPEGLRRSIVKTSSPMSPCYIPPESWVWNPIRYLFDFFSPRLLSPSLLQKIKIKMHFYSTSLTKSMQANTNYLFSQYEQPLLGQVNKL